MFFRTVFAPDLVNGFTVGVFRLDVVAVLQRSGKDLGADLADDLALVDRLAVDVGGELGGEGLEAGGALAGPVLGGHVFGLVVLGELVEGDEPVLVGAARLCAPKITKTFKKKSNFRKSLW